VAGGGTTTLPAGAAVTSAVAGVAASAGAATVAVRLRVPVRPFPDGVLAGSLSPRQMAEKAHAAPREAAALIESGAVARWGGGALAMAVCSLSFAVSANLLYGFGHVNLQNAATN